jgi:transposase InsO family protein
MIYRYFGISKQAVHQYQVRSFNRQVYEQDLLEQVKLQRQIHPRMGSKVLHQVLKPEIGRIGFEILLRKNGFNLRKLKSYHRTTDSSWVRYKNLLAGRRLNSINQAWVSDLTYYMLKDRVCYLTTIMDLYSRKIIGYAASLTMFSEESSMKCLKMALRTRGRLQPDLIHHSDRGSQYRFSKYIDLIQKAGGRISMCRSVYDNPHMERLNGTIKNDYLIPLGIDTFDELKQKLPIVINRYNSLRPHSELNKMTPAAFEQSQSLIPLSKRKQTVIKSEIFTTHSN